MILWIIKFESTDHWTSELLSELSFFHWVRSSIHTFGIINIDLVLRDILDDLLCFHSDRDDFHIWIYGSMDLHGLDSLHCYLFGLCLYLQIFISCNLGFLGIFLKIPSGVLGFRLKIAGFGSVFFSSFKKFIL
jgi:hypothetical protein